MTLNNSILFWNLEQPLPSRSFISQCTIFLYFWHFLQGNGVIELWSDVSVNDGGWHEVKAQFNPSYMEVTVDLFEF